MPNLIFDLLANDKASSKVKGFGDTVEQTSGRFEGIKDALAKVGAAIAVTFAADKVVDFGKDVIHSASELQDSTAAASVIFGDSMGTIIDQSKTAAAQFGLSSQQVISAANTFGTYGKSAGLAGQDLAGFSTKMTGLAGDLASFKGTTTEQAIEAIGAAMRGEAEPIRAYGVLLDDATLKNRALALGLISSTKDALSPANKVLAAQAEILAQTGDAQGDFSRTSDSAANTQHALQAKVENLKAALGERLLPAWTAILGIGSKVADFFGATILPLLDKVGAGASAMFDLLFKGDFTGKFAEIFGQEEDSTIVVNLFKIRDTAIAVFGGVKTAVQGLFDILFKGDYTGALSRAFGIEEDSTIVVRLFQIRDVFIEVFTKAKAAGAGFAQWVTGSLVPGIRDLSTWGMKNKDWLVPVAVGFLAIIAAIKVYNTVMAVWRGLTIAATAVQAAFNVVMALNPVAVIALAIIGLIAALAYFFTQTETGRKVWQSFTDVISASWVWIKEHWPLLLVIITGPIGAAVLIVKDHWASITNVVSNVIEWIKGHWQLLLGIITGPIGLAVVEIATHWDTIMGFFQAIPGRIGSALKGVANALTFPFRTAFNAIADLWNGTIGGFSMNLPAILGGAHLSIPSMPHVSAFADGTAFAPGGLALVGERGPELVNLPRGSQVFPNGTGPTGGPVHLSDESIERLATAILTGQRAASVGVLRASAGRAR